MFFIKIWKSAFSRYFFRYFFVCVFSFRYSRNTSIDILSDVPHLFESLFILLYSPFCLLVRLSHHLSCLKSRLFSCQLKSAEPLKLHFSLYLLCFSRQKFPLRLFCFVFTISVLFFFDILYLMRHCQSLSVIAFRNILNIFVKHALVSLLNLTFRSLTGSFSSLCVYIAFSCLHVHHFILKSGYFR